MPSNPQFDKNQTGYAIRPYDLSEDILKGRVFLLEMPHMSPVVLNCSGAIPALYTAAAAQVDVIDPLTGFGPGIEMYQTTAQALPPAVHASKGLVIGGDLVDNESVEYVPGGNRASNPLGYTAPTSGQLNPDLSRVHSITLELADVSGSDQLLLGWRKQEAYQVPVSLLTTGDALYTDFFGIGFSGTANPNVIKVMTDINNGGSTLVTSTLFTVPDNGIVKLEVRIVGRRAVYLINGVRVGNVIKQDGVGTTIASQSTITPPTYTIDVGDFMIPWFFTRYDTTAPGNIYVRRWECAPLRALGLEGAPTEV